jgi:hypothetical protein
MEVQQKIIRLKMTGHLAEKVSLIVVKDINNK